MRRGLAVVATGLMLSGCATLFSTYPEQANRWMMNFENGQSDQVVSTLTPKLDSRDGLLYGLELGRISQLAGQSDVSKQAFESVIARFDEIDAQSRIDASDQLAGAASLLTNDNARPYRGRDYERIFAHTYQALNYLRMRDAQGAAVELRRAALEQRLAAERREKAIAKAEREAREENVDINQFDEQFSGLNVAAGRVKSSFQNAFTFYLSAVYWEAAGDLNAALIDFKKAYEINPGAEFIRQDILRVSRRLGDRVKARVPGRNEGSIVVLFEQSRVPPRRELSLPIPTIHGAFAVAFPTYDPNDFPDAVPLSLINGEGRDVLRTQVVADVGAMAARSLKEEMPGILVRQTLRAAAKYALQKEANDQNPWAGLATNIYNLVSERADLRSWMTLPAYVQAGRAIVPAGTSRFTLSGAGVNQEIEVDVTPGGTTIVRIVTAGGSPIVETYKI